MRLASALLTLWMLTFRRLLWSTNTAMLLFPLAACGLFLAFASYDQKFFEIAPETPVQFLDANAERGATRQADVPADTDVRSWADAVGEDRWQTMEFTEDRRGIFDISLTTARVRVRPIAGAAPITTTLVVRRGIRNRAHRRYFLTSLPADTPIEKLVRSANLARNRGDSFSQFSNEFVLGLFTSFVLPIVALAYATTSLGADREDRTLLYLLVRPIPRPAILLTKMGACLPLVWGIALTGYWTYCRLAGPAGTKAFWLYLPALGYLSLGYISLFHLFAVRFRHATILALVYALFVEFFVGNMPGMIKRAALNYYGRSLLFAAGEPAGLKLPDGVLFDPLTPETASLALLAVSAGGLLLGMLIFSRREY